MNILHIIWDLEDDAEGNIQHIAEHGISTEEVAYIVYAGDRQYFSRSSGRPMVSGFLPDGRCITVVFEWVDDETIFPVTAYEVEE